MKGIKKHLYFFSKEFCEGDAGMKNIIGGKGANLAEMASHGLPVPPGFTISTDACMDFYKNGKQMSESLLNEIDRYLERLELCLGQKFGDVKEPLLISVRSGARASMPGMMDTILNIGLNDETVEGLWQKSGNKWFAYDSYRRLFEMYGDVVACINREHFAKILERHKKNEFLADERDFSIDQIKAIIEEYKQLFHANNQKFPQDVKGQLTSAIRAVFESWMNERAIKYRKINGIPEDWGTAVNIQSMVFGNFGDTSGTGVCFTRNPSTGVKDIFGEYLINAQGEDVVAGTHTPAQITNKGKEENFSDSMSLEERMPDVFDDLVKYCVLLDKHFKDMQDIEFTIQENKLYLLQTRNGKRSAEAAVKIARDMHDEGLITKQDAILRITPDQINNLLHPRIDLDTSLTLTLLTKGLPASPGAGSGTVVFSPYEAEELGKIKKVILVRKDTSPEDIGGMHSAQGILTTKGGMTSHAAVVARGMGKPCIVGAGQIEIDEESHFMKIGGHTIKEGDSITLNGSTGEVILGEVKTTVPDVTGDLKEILSWCAEFKRLGIRANADTPADAAAAIRFGAQGIGLCRTEHMFFAEERIFQMRRLIISHDPAEQMNAIEELGKYQRHDFKKIFDVIDGLPTTIRLLDPPLHEFLPLQDSDITSLASKLGMQEWHLRNRIDSLKEQNPMLGHRGCRLGISNPDIYKMQVRAIFEAACESYKMPMLEIMIPLVQSEQELLFLKDILTREIDDVMARNKRDVKYLFGTMIELPRAAIISDKLAEISDFFSYGTNDLTQTTMGLSRDDSAQFLHSYLENNIFANDPFLSIDVEGVGSLVKMSSEKGRAVNSNIKLGICGEHGGDAKSVEFFHQVGLHYVSCSPYRVPIAQLAAAQAAIKG
jgi:pyruvate,orthophosphate dikinase